jgi:hypothetical protein
LNSHEFNSENTKPRIPRQRFQYFFSVPLRLKNAMKDEIEGTLDSFLPQSSRGHRDALIFNKENWKSSNPSSLCLCG